MDRAPAGAEAGSSLHKSLYLPHFLSKPIDDSKFPEDCVAPRTAFRAIQGLRNLDATPRLNLASFVTTYMEPECQELMMEAISVNYIDTEEYPSTEKIKEMATNMLADLWHADKDSPVTGTDTVGSSEAVLLGGLALKRRWVERRKAAGKDASKPNIVMGTETHVVWEKLTNYIEIEPKWVPNRPGQYVACTEDLVAACDENTIEAGPQPPKTPGENALGVNAEVWVLMREATHYAYRHFIVSDEDGNPLPFKNNPFPEGIDMATGYVLTRVAEANATKVIRIAPGTVPTNSIIRAIISKRISSFAHDNRGDRRSPKWQEDRAAQVAFFKDHFVDESGQYRVPCEFQQLLKAAKMTLSELCLQLPRGHGRPNRGRDAPQLPAAAGIGNNAPASAAGLPTDTTGAAAEVDGQVQAANRLRQRRQELAQAAVAAAAAAAAVAGGGAAGGNASARKRGTSAAVAVAAAAEAAEDGADDISPEQLPNKMRRRVRARGGARGGARAVVQGVDSGSAAGQGGRRTPRGGRAGVANGRGRGRK